MRRRYGLGGYPLLMIILAVILAVALILCGISALLIASAKDGLREQNAAKAFEAGDVPYAQVSVFASPDSSLSADALMNTDATIDAALVEAGIELENENARLYVRAYSTEGSVRVATPSHELITASVDATVTAVGGDFFLIHQLDFLSGQPFSDGDFSTRRVVLDELCAWRLYGAMDVAGMEVEIGGELYEIAGVVKRADYKEYGIEPRLYMPYAEYKTFDESAAVTAFEVLMPDPITDFASDLVSDIVGLSEDECVKVVNSERFDVVKLLSKLPTFMDRGIRTDDIVFPHWENNAIRTENYAILYALGFAVSGGLAILTITVGVGASLMKLTKYISEYKEKHRR